MNEFEKEAVITALKKMFRGSHFNICTFDKCTEIAGAIPAGRDYRALSALHCVDWGDMSPGLRDEVYERIVGTFQLEGFNLIALDMVFNEGSKAFELKKPPKKSLRLRLLGGNK